jgi:hypothetical protein
MMLTGYRLPPAMDARPRPAPALPGTCSEVADMVRNRNLLWINQLHQ